jgi:hypothetical protein
MKAKLVHGGDLKKWVVVFDTGDEVIGRLGDFAKENRLAASQITAIGAFSDCVLGFFQFEKRDYKRIPVKEQVEVLSLLGDVTQDESGAPKLHVHVVVGKSDGSAAGGHLIEAHVRPTLEVILTESPANLRRGHDPASGLALIQINAND